MTEPPFLEAPPSGETSEDERNRDGSLLREINVAARPFHTRLNQLILARLPLALPPQCISPTLYAIGLVHFASIYFAFESAWTRLLNTSELHAESSLTKALKVLYIPSLARSRRLQADLATLLHTPSTTINTDLEKNHNAPHSSAFVSHIHTAISSSPHLLLTYAHIFYLALFNGGRQIRAQLLLASTSWDLPLVAPTFYSDSRTENISYTDTATTPSGFAFWYFSTPQDGEDLKNLFKARFAACEPYLTEQQRQDIIQEAVYIFQSCIELVEELDTMVATGTLNGVVRDEQSGKPGTKMLDQSPRTAALAKEGGDEGSWEALADAETIVTDVGIGMWEGLVLFFWVWVMGVVEICGAVWWGFEVAAGWMERWTGKSKRNDNSWGSRGEEKLESREGKDAGEKK